MKIYLDLLPAWRRAEIKRKDLVRKLFWQEVALFLPVVFLVVFMYSLGAILDLKIKSEELMSAAIEQDQRQVKLNSFEETFQSENSKIDQIEAIHSRHLQWNGAVAKITGLVPQGVQIKGLATKDYQFTLLGWARDRQELLDFQQAITDSGCFENVQSPLSNLVSKENLDFTLNFTIKPDCLKKNE